MQNLLWGLSYLPLNVFSCFFSASVKSFSSPSSFYTEVERVLSKEIIEDPEQIQEFLQTHLSTSDPDTMSYYQMWDDLGCAPDLYTQINALLQTSSIEALSETLLKYAEFCKRQDEPLPVIEKIQDAALKFSLLLIAKNARENFFHESRCKILELKARMDELSKKQIVQISFSSVEEMVRNIVPKDFSSEQITQYSKSLQKEIQTRLNQRLFQESRDECFVVSPIVCWMQVRSDDVRVICYDDLTGVDMVFGGKEVYATEAIFSIGARSPKIHTTRVQVTSENWGLKECFQRKKLLQRIPHYPVPPLTAFFLGGKALISRDSQNQTLQNIRVENPYALSSEDCLEICRQVLQQLQILQKYDLVSCNVRMPSIGILRDGEKVKAILQSFAYLVAKGTYISGMDHDMQYRIGALANNGRSLPCADRYALIIMLAELFSLWNPLETYTPPLSRRSLEDQALRRIEPNLFVPHYRKILELREEHKGLCRAFSEALLDYANALRSSGEEGLQISILEKFASDAVIIPKIMDLLEPSLTAELSQRKCESLEDMEAKSVDIPSYKMIQRVLDEASQEVFHLQNNALQKREKTQLTYIDEEQIAGFVRQSLDSNSPFLQSCTEALLEELRSFLAEHPEVGSEKRFSKHADIPFSFWVRVGKETLEIDAILSHLEPLGIGGNKKAKVIQSFSEGLKGLSRAWAFPSGHKVHQAILQIPEAHKYFASLPKIHAAYLGKNLVPKWEGSQTPYQVNLYDAWKNQEIPVDLQTSIPLTTLDFISCLEHVSCGLKLIASHGISHGDIKRENIGIYLPSMQSYEVRVTDFDHSQFFQQIFPERQRYRYWNSFRHRGFIDRRTDLYSLALLVGEILIFDFSVTQRKSKEEIERRYAQRIPEDLRECFPSGKISRDNCVPLLQRVQDLHDQGNVKESFALQRLICEALILDKVFALQEKAFEANQSGVFPEFEEIEEVIAYCRKESEWVGAHVIRI